MRVGMRTDMRSAMPDERATMDAMVSGKSLTSSRGARRGQPRVLTSRPALAPTHRRQQQREMVKSAIRVVLRTRPTAKFAADSITLQPDKQVWVTLVTGLG